LVVMDGWGIAPPGPGNYISQAQTPNFDYFFSHYPHCQNKAAGQAVGLPKGTEGNSEVGHLHMGAGRIVLQMYEVINRAIRDKSFFENKVIKRALSFARKKNSSVHLMGLCSDGGVHSHINHLLAILKMAKITSVKKVFIHFFADGRDVPERSALRYLKMIEKREKRLKLGRVSTVIGRYYAMDRDNNWDRTKRAYDMLTLGRGFKEESAKAAIENSYKRGDPTDYYIQPNVVVNQDKKPLGLIRDNDSVIFFNLIFFRSLSFETIMKGTGFVEWLGLGLPSGYNFSSALPWSAVSIIT